MSWLLHTKTFAQITGQQGGEPGVDDEFAQKSFENVGCWIMGRNMFGPIRGNWPNNEWRGWWGEEPPYHVPVFVLTHYERESLEMKGGTVFHFWTQGIKTALEQARKAANGKDIRIGGGVSTVRQFLQAGLVDELHLAVSPVFLGSGEHLYSGIDMRILGFNQFVKTDGGKATHVIIKKA